MSADLWFSSVNIYIDNFDSYQNIYFKHEIHFLFQGILVFIKTRLSVLGAGKGFKSRIPSAWVGGLG